MPTIPTEPCENCVTAKNKGLSRTRCAVCGNWRPLTDEEEDKMNVLRARRERRGVKNA